MLRSLVFFLVVASCLALIGCGGANDASEVVVEVNYDSRVDFSQFETFTVLTNELVPGAPEPGGVFWNPCAWLAPVPVQFEVGNLLLPVGPEPAEGEDPEPIFTALQRRSWDRSRTSRKRSATLCRRSSSNGPSSGPATRDQRQLPVRWPG
jgi:hypothetical protein